MPIQQGDIYSAEVGGAEGSEAGIPHPYVVIQEDYLNRSRLPTVVVCALTSNRKRASLPGNVLLEPGEGDLPRQSVVEVSKLSTLDKTQLGPLIGRLSKARVEEILAGIRFLQRMTEPDMQEDVEHETGGPFAQLIQEYIDRDQILGLSIAVLNGGEMAYGGGFGLTSVEEGRWVTPGTLFGIGSISKTLLAVLILRLVEAGFLDLDTPVIDYLPDFHFSRRDYGERVTLSHLLSHTSGLPGAGKDWGPPGSEALKQFVHEQLAHHSFLAPPGRIHLYSSTAITLAGYVAEAVCGRPYRELLAELVLQPLGMARTTFDHASAMTYPLALPHEPGADGRPAVTHRLVDNAAGEPSGFAFSSALDLANLALMLLGRGRFRGQEFLRPESVARMFDPLAERPMPGARHPLSTLYAGYGLGLQTGTYGGQRVVRHGGVSQSYNCFFELLPDLGKGMVVLTNYSQEPQLSELVVRLYDRLLGLPDRKVTFLPPPQPDETARVEDMKHYTGAYLNVEYGRLIRFHFNDKSLWIEEDGTQNRLRAIIARDFYSEVEEGPRLPVAFVPENGAPAHYVYVAGQPFIRFELNEVYQPDRDELAPFAGLYRDPTNLDPSAVLEIRLENGALMLQGDGADEGLRPLAPGVFLSSLGLIEFVHQNGKVRYLILGRATRYDSLEP